MRGLLSYAPEENPLMYNWNKVYVGYCDGASFGGDVSDPVSLPDDPEKKVNSFMVLYTELP
jgi:hypothetical protein